MAITSVREIGPRAFRLSLDGLSREYTRTFQVITDDPENEGLEVLTGGLENGLPVPGDYYNVLPYGDIGALVDGYDPQQDDPDHPDVWTVTVKYRNRTADPAAAQGGATVPGQPAASGGGGSPSTPQNTNPLFARPGIQWGDRTLLRPILNDLGDLTANPPELPRVIANSAQTPFATQMKEIRCDVLTFSRNEPKYRPWTMQPYKGSINSTIFQGRPARTVLCENITSSYQFSDGIGYWPTVYTFVFGPEDDPYFWELNLVDAGPYYRPSAGAMPIAFTERTGIGSGELFLNGTNGQKHSGYDSNWVLATGSEPNILRFYTRIRKDFAPLKIIDPAYI